MYFRAIPTGAASTNSNTHVLPTEPVYKSADGWGVGLMLAITEIHSILKGALRPGRV